MTIYLTLLLNSGINNFDTMDIHSKLKQIGLNKSEITIYLYLLENGISSVQNVSHGTNITRTNCYYVFNELIEKGLVYKVVDNGKIMYVANGPDSLLVSLSRQKDVINQILPDLKGLYTVNKNKPKITYFNSLDEVKKIYTNSLGAKTICRLATNVNSSLLSNFINEYQKDLKNRDIEYTSTTINHVNDNSVDILLWENNIAFISLTEPYFGTVITNVALANTVKYLLKLIADK